MGRRSTTRANPPSKTYGFAVRWSFSIYPTGRRPLDMSNLQSGLCFGMGSILHRPILRELLRHLTCGVLLTAAGAFLQQ